MKASSDTGVIYAITSKTSGKSYIGQAKDYKYKNGIPFRYGVTGRWDDHNSVNSKTKIHLAIKKYGKEDFIVTELIRLPIGELDAKEAETIAYNNTLEPNGYNVMRHSRVKCRDETNIADFYLKTAKSIELKPIKSKGENSIIYLYIENENTEKVRLTFGQGNGTTFNEAVEEALDFIIPFQNKGIPASIHPNILGISDPLACYQNKIENFIGKKIHRITIGKQKNKTFYLVVLNIYDGDKSKICFGGKTVEFLEAYKIALMFIQRIKNKDTKIEEMESIKEFLKSATGSC